MNIIFLDIDGVLCTTRTCVAQRLGDPVSGRFREFDIVGCGLIRTICHKSDAKIVISSTWRLGADITGKNKEGFKSSLHDNLEEGGLIQYIHEDWRTKDLRFSTEDIWRGHEIQEWLGRHPEVKKYVILDDDCDMLLEQKPYFVNTDANNGITYEDYKKIIEILKNEEPTAT